MGFFSHIKFECIASLLKLWQVYSLFPETDLIPNILNTIHFCYIYQFLHQLLLVLWKFTIKSSFRFHHIPFQNRQLFAQLHIHVDVPIVLYCKLLYFIFHLDYVVCSTFSSFKMNCGFLFPEIYFLIQLLIQICYICIILFEFSKLRALLQILVLHIS